MRPVSLLHLAPAWATKTAGLLATCAAIDIVFAQGSEAVSMGPTGALALVAATATATAGGIWATRHLSAKMTPTREPTEAPEKSAEMTPLQAVSRAVDSLQLSASTLAIGQETSRETLARLEIQISALAAQMTKFSVAAEEASKANAPLPQAYRALVHDLDSFASWGGARREAFYTAICNGNYNEVLRDQEAATHKEKAAIHDRLGELLLSEIENSKSDSPNLAIVTLGYVATLQKDRTASSRLDQILQAKGRQFLRVEYHIGAFLADPSINYAISLFTGARPDPFPEIEYACNVITNILNTKNLSGAYFLRDLHIGLLEAAIAISGRTGWKSDVPKNAAYIEELRKPSPFLASAWADWQNDDGANAVKTAALEFRIHSASRGWTGRNPFDIIGSDTVDTLLQAHSDIAVQFTEEAPKFLQWVENRVDEKLRYLDKPYDEQQKAKRLNVVLTAMEFFHRAKDDVRFARVSETLHPEYNDSTASYRDEAQRVARGAVYYLRGDAVWRALTAEKNAYGEKNPVRDLYHFAKYAWQTSHAAWAKDILVTMLDTPAMALHLYDDEKPWIRQLKVE